MSHILAALLLGVLALLGGTPATAANALPVPGPGGGLVAGSAAHAAAPDTHASGPSVAVRPDDPARWAEAGHLPGPRAGADRPHAPQHLPPPGHGALPPRPQNLIPPRGTAPGATGASPFFAARARAALPGVRGPPGAEAGQPALHRSRCTDLSSRPSL